MTRLSDARVAGGLLTIAALAAIVGGLVLLGPPAEERARRLDERRVRDLMALAGAIDLYWTRRGTLPSSLTALQREPGGSLPLLDPRTNEHYEYRQLESEAYELCARFDRQGPPSATGAEFWSHAAGPQCFRREVRKVR